MTGRAAQTDSEDRAMPKTVFTVIGLQRTGNHAVIDWLGGLFPSHAFLNNNAHDLFADPGRVAELLARHDADCLICSFEDSPGKMADVSVPLTESVIPFPADRFPGVTAHTLYILRDPYNLWASRQAARARKPDGTGLTSDPSWELYRANWMALAGQQKAAPDSTILFNAWSRDESYRRAVCDRLGGRYSEATMDQVPTEGGGSSFDGLPRPKLSTMLRNWRHYLSADFLGRIARRPAYYLRRLLSRPATGKTLKVNQRWQGLQGTPEAAPLFADVELHRESLRIFGAASLPPAPRES